MRRRTMATTLKECPGAESASGSGKSARKSGRNVLPLCGMINTRSSSVRAATPSPRNSVGTNPHGAPSGSITTRIQLEELNKLENSSEVQLLQRFEFDPDLPLVIDDPLFSDFRLKYAKNVESLKCGLEWTEIESVLNFISPMHKLTELDLLIKLGKVDADDVGTAAREPEAKRLKLDNGAGAKVKVKAGSDTKPVHTSPSQVQSLRFRLFGVRSLKVDFKSSGGDTRPFGDLAGTLLKTFPAVKLLTISDSVQRVILWKHERNRPNTPGFQFLLACRPHLEKLQMSETLVNFGGQMRLHAQELKAMSMSDGLNPFPNLRLSHLSLDVGDVSELEGGGGKGKTGEGEGQDAMAMERRLAPLLGHKDTLRHLELDFAFGVNCASGPISVPILPEVRTLVVNVTLALASEKARDLKYFVENWNANVNLDFGTKLPKLEELHWNLSCKGIYSSHCPTCYGEQDREGKLRKRFFKNLTKEVEKCATLRKLKITDLFDQIEEDILTVAPKMLAEVKEKFPNLACIITSKGTEVSWESIKERYLDYAKNKF